MGAMSSETGDLSGMVLVPKEAQLDELCCLRDFTQVCERISAKWAKRLKERFFCVPFHSLFRFWTTEKLANYFG
jgi:hypothetical protein